MIEKEQGEFKQLPLTRRKRRPQCQKGRGNKGFLTITPADKRFKGGRERRRNAEKNSLNRCSGKKGEKKNQENEGKGGTLKKKLNSSGREFFVIKKGGIKSHLPHRKRRNSRWRKNPGPEQKKKISSVRIGGGRDPPLWKKQLPPKKPKNFPKLGRKEPKLSTGAAPPLREGALKCAKKKN